MTTSAAPPSTDGAVDPPRSPFAARWWIASAVVVGLVVLLGLFLGAVALFRPGQHHTGPAGPDPVVTSPCGLTTGSQAMPAVTPTTTWRLVGTMAAPADPGVGPGSSTSGVPSCYAPTPLGALYAAANFLAATSVPDTRLAAATHLTAPGAGRDAALADLRAGNLGGVSTTVQIVGFYFVGYTPATAASVTLAVRTGQSAGLAQIPLSLVWSAGSWLVQLPVTGSPYTAATALPSLGGFVAWQGA